ncbi:MAG: hypothetical protein WDM80_00905 [Limisphaerales bacterium]
MDFTPPKLKVLVLLFLATGSLAAPVHAQQSGQPIIFSSPHTGATVPAAPSSDNIRPGMLPETIQAPMQVFDFSPPSDRPVIQVAPADYSQQRMHRLLEERKYWTLLTPEEILGSAATGKVLATELDALGNEKNQTQLERYLERENRLRNGLTNNWQNGRDASPWNISRDRQNLHPLDAGQDNAAARDLGQLLHFKQVQHGFTTENGKVGWSAFSQPLTQIQSKLEPNMEKIASMERFRQLLDPTPAPATAESPESKLFPVPKPVVDPFLVQSDFAPNPVGASFIPLSSGIARPMGLMPLPGVTRTAPPVTAPVSKVQPPPWLLQGPQPFVMPQRKF